MENKAEPTGVQEILLQVTPTFYHHNHFWAPLHPLVLVPTSTMILVPSEHFPFFLSNTLPCQCCIVLLFSSKVVCCRYSSLEQGGRLQASCSCFITTGDPDAQQQPSSHAKRPNPSCHPSKQFSRNWYKLHKHHSSARRWHFSNKVAKLSCQVQVELTHLNSSEESLHFKNTNKMFSQIVWNGSWHSPKAFTLRKSQYLEYLLPSLFKYSEFKTLFSAPSVSHKCLMWQKGSASKNWLKYFLLKNILSAQFLFHLTQLKNYLVWNYRFNFKPGTQLKQNQNWDRPTGSMDWK